MASEVTAMMVDALLSTTTECPHHKKMRLEKEAQGAAAAGAMDHSAHQAMDHSGHGSHNLHDGMVMSFHGGYTETILFDFWQTDSMTIFLVSCFALFIVAVLYEGLKLARERIAVAESKRRRPNCCDTTNGGVESRKMLSDTANGDNVVIMDKNNQYCQQNGHGPTSTDSADGFVSRLTNKTHIIQTLLHMAQLTVSYLLMLVFMTYNSWLCLSIVLGSGLGYFIFGLKRLSPIDPNEHCH